MTYDCINAYEDILDNMIQSKIINRAEFDALDDEDTAGVATLAVEGLMRLTADRAALLAALHNTAALLKRGEIDGDGDTCDRDAFDVDDLLHKIIDAARAAIAQAEQVQS